MTARLDDSRIVFPVDMELGHDRVMFDARLTGRNRFSQQRMENA